MALLSDVLTAARTFAQTDSNGLTDTKGIVFGNEALVDFHRRLIKSGVDASQIQEAYQDGTANTGTYLYPSDALWLKGIELNYADTTAQNYRTAIQVDVSNLPSNVPSFGWLRTNASVETPYFDDRGDWFEIFPTPTSAHNVSQMMRIFYFKKPTEFTATSDTIAYPPSMDYRILSWRVASNYAKSLGNLEQASIFDMEYVNPKEYISFLTRGSQQPLQSVPIQIDGWQY